MTSLVYSYMVLFLFLPVTNLFQDANLDFVKTIILRSFCVLDIFSPNPYNKYSLYVDSLLHFEAELPHMADRPPTRSTNIIIFQPRVCSVCLLKLVILPWHNVNMYSKSQLTIPYLLIKTFITFIFPTF